MSGQTQGITDLDDGPRKRKLLVANEQTKLLGNGLNTLGIGLIVAGVFTPLAGVVFGTLKGGDSQVLLFICAFAVSGLILMGFAQIGLEGLEV